MSFIFIQFEPFNPFQISSAFSNFIFNSQYHLISNIFTLGPQLPKKLPALFLSPFHKYIQKFPIILSKIPSSLRSSPKSHQIFICIIRSQILLIVKDFIKYLSKTSWENYFRFFYKKKCGVNMLNIWKINKYLRISRHEACGMLRW